MFYRDWTLPARLMFSVVAYSNWKDVRVGVSAGISYGEFLVRLRMLSLEIDFNVWRAEAQPDEGTRKPIPVELPANVISLDSRRRKKA